MNVTTLKLKLGVGTLTSLSLFYFMGWSTKPNLTVVLEVIVFSSRVEWTLNVPIHLVIILMLLIFVLCNNLTAPIFIPKI